MSETTPTPLTFPVFTFAGTQFHIRQIAADAEPDATNLNPVIGDTGNTLVSPVNHEGTVTYAAFAGFEPKDEDLATKRPYAARTFPADVTAPEVITALIHPNAVELK